MKKILNNLFLICVFAFGLGIFVVGCNDNNYTITLGKYNTTQQTFSAVTTGYNLEIHGTDLILKGIIPYSSGMLGLDEGNIVAIKITPNSKIASDSATTIKTTNKLDTQNGGWNIYGKEALESDGSIIWVTSVNKDNDVQIKIKWNANINEIIYTLKVDSSATLQTT